MKKIVLAVVGLAFVGLVLVRVSQASQAKKAAAVVSEEAAVVVKGAKVSPRDIAQTVALTGQIRPKNEVEIFPKLGGRIEAVKVKVGDRVKAGTVLAVVEHKELAWQVKQAEAAARMAEANLSQARDELKRTETLFKSGGAPQAALDGAKTKAAVAEAQLAQAEAAAGLARTALSNASVTSPIGGIVTRKRTDVGAMVGPTTSLFQVQDAAELKLEAAVEANEAMRMQENQPVEIEVDGLPGEKFEGKVSVLSPTLDSQTRRAWVEVSVPNAKGRILPNMFARATVRVGTLASALSIPRSAVFESVGGKAVYVIREGKAQLVKPAFGLGDADFLVIETGLNEGDVVATAGLGLLADGAKAQATEN